MCRCSNLCCCLCCSCPSGPVFPASLALSFAKTDDVGLPLPGAQFTLYSCNYPVASAVSNASGIVNFGELCPGTYTMVETASPPGYETNSNVYTVTVDRCAGVAVNGIPTSIFNIVNTPIQIITSPTPTLSPINQLDTVVTGTGVPGCAITVTWPDSQITLVTVGANGLFIAAVPASVTLVPGQIITVYQTCSGALPSLPASQIVTLATP